MTKKIDPAHLAKLTNISLTEKEVTILTSQFSTTLDTISVLNELDTKNVSATPQVTNLSNVFRKDVIETDYMFSQEEALANAPNTHEGFIVVKAIFDDN